MGPDAFQVAVLAERLREGGERLVQRVGRDGGDRAAEHIRFNQPHHRQEVGSRKKSLRVVVIQLQKEGVCDIHLQLAQVLEGEPQVGIGLRTQCHGAEVAREVPDVAHQCLHAFPCGRRRAGVCLERLVNLAHVRNLARFDREIVAHEGVEVCAVRLLSEIHLHGSPELLVELGLQLRVQTHQDEVADQVGLAQLPPRRVHALEDQLRVVLIATERHVYHKQLT